MKVSNDEASRGNAKIGEQQRKVLGKVKWPPSQRSFIKRKCYRVTEDNYDTRNKENSFNVIPSNLSHSPSPELEGRYQQQNIPLENNSSKSNSLHDQGIANLEEKFAKELEIKIINPPSAFESFMTPTAKWNKSFLCDSESRTPPYQSAHANKFSTRETLEIQTNGYCEESSAAGASIDTCAVEEEEELVSILQSSMTSTGAQSCYRLFKDSPPLISGRENPAIPTEEIFRQGHLE